MISWLAMDRKFIGPQFSTSWIRAEQAICMHVGPGVILVIEEYLELTGAAILSLEMVLDVKPKDFRVAV